MKRILSTILNRKNKKLNLSLVGLLVIVATVSISSLLQPTTTTYQSDDNITQFGTSYDYKATITPNILYPEGGTIDVGNTIFKKITTEIPLHIKSIINTDNVVAATGTYEIQLVVKAGDLWERAFPLQQKQSFKLEGTEISLIDNTFNIDLNEINSFITKVEEETGIRSDQYLYEVAPNIKGTVIYEGKEIPIPEQDNLVFQSSYEEITLVSEKALSSTFPFTRTEVITNTFDLFGTVLPLGPVRIISTILSVLLLLPITYLYKDVIATRTKKTQVDKINKKYGSRVIPVAQKLNTDQKSLITLQSFNSILKVADEKELPIFCHKLLQEGNAIYFILDGDYVFTYETISADLVRATEGDEAFANG